MNSPNKNKTKSRPQQIKQQIARAELWLARHPDEDPVILERYRARIRELRQEVQSSLSTDASCITHFRDGPRENARH
jgi:hypothetical protein